MKKTVLCAALILCSTSMVNAAPTYGTRMPEKGQLFGGLQHHEVIYRPINKDYGSLSSRQEFVLLSYGVSDWFSLDLKAGAGSIRHERSGQPTIKYDDPLWGGGYGFRIRLYKGDKVTIVSGFQHISIHPRTVKSMPEKHNAIYDDWQASATASYALKPFTPYVGVRWGSTDYIHRINNDGDRHYVAESRRTDIVLGADIPFSDRMWINVEGQAGGGEALSAGLNFRF